MLRLLKLTMFIFLLSIGLTDPIKNVFAENHGPEFTIDQVITHPLFLLLIGGGVSGITSIWVKRRLQARRESFQMKSQLVTKINRSATKLILALEFYARKETLKYSPSAP